jgi:hypothetical protein
MTLKKKEEKKKARRFRILLQIGFHTGQRRNINAPSTIDAAGRKIICRDVEQMECASSGEQLQEVIYSLQETVFLLLIS